MSDFSKKRALETIVDMLAPDDPVLDLMRELAERRLSGELLVEESKTPRREPGLVKVA